MRKRIVTTSAVIAGLLLVGSGTAIAIINADNKTAQASEKSDKVVSVPAVEHANTEAKSSSASPSPSASASEKAAAEAKAAEVAAGATVANTTSGGAASAPVVDAAPVAAPVAPAAPTCQMVDTPIPGYQMCAITVNPEDIIVIDEPSTEVQYETLFQ